jgi:hypothetical protein
MFDLIVTIAGRPVIKPTDEADAFARPLPRWRFWERTRILVPCRRHARSRPI